MSLVIATPEELREPRAFFGEAEPGECPSLTREDDGSYQMFVTIEELRPGYTDHRSTTDAQESAAIRVSWGL